MHHVLRSTIQINILLDSFSLCSWPIELAASVKKSECGPHAIEHHKFDCWHERSSKHGNNQRGTNIVVPFIGKIRVFSSEWNPKQECLACVCVRKKQKYGSIEKLSDENACFDNLGLLALSVISNVLDQQNVNTSEDKVDSNDRERYKLS